MAKKEFKSESKRLLDLMINSIYTNKDIFLRELISNASDALDKLYYRSLTDKKVKVDKDDLSIDLAFDRDSRTLTITDNGCGIPKEQLTTAFMRHATSKLRNAEEILNIKSLGFRGEALSSISAVSRVEMITKPKSQLMGCRYVIEGSQEMNLDEVGAPDGTTIISLISEYIFLPNLSRRGSHTPERTFPSPKQAQR